MAIVFSSATFVTGSPVIDGSGITLNVTVGTGANRFLLIYGMLEDSTGYFPTATVNGVGATFLSRKWDNTNEIDAWYFVAPNTGVNTIYLQNLTGASLSGGSLSVMTFYGVDPVSAIENVFTDTAVSAGPFTATITAVTTGSYIVHADNRSTVGNVMTILTTGVTLSVNPLCTGMENGLYTYQANQPGVYALQYTVTTSTTNHVYSIVSLKQAQTAVASNPFKEFLTTPNANFLNLQSGNAAPYWYIEGIISGVTAVIGDTNTATNWLIDGGQIDREKPVFPGDRSSIFSSDVTIKVDNSTKRFSPRDTSSIFYNNDYLESPFNYYAGFRDVSGTAVLVQRGAFILDNLRLDSRNSVAYLRLRDKFKRALDREIGTNDVSGTAIQHTLTGILPGHLAIQSLFVTGAGLTGGDLSLQTASISFNNLSLSRQTVADAVTIVSEASDGYVYTSRRGILTYRINEPVFGTASASFVINESNYAENVYFEETKNDRLYKVTVEFQSGSSVATVSETTGVTGQSITISNDAIQSTAEAAALGNRLRDRFSGQVTRIELPCVWLPSIDIGDTISVFSNNCALSGQVFEVYKIQEEPTSNQMRLFLLTQRNLRSAEGNKFAFFSDPSAADSGGNFTGGTGEANGWQAGYGFFAAVNTGFDADGNVNNAVTTGYSASGVGGTGIEVPFLFY